MSNEQHAWLITPRDPVIVRDGRPFGPDPGARAQSLPFPLPATVAGAVRTRCGEAQGGFDSSGAMSAAVRTLPVCGPFLVELAAENAPPQLLLPAPGDALTFAGAADHTLRRRWLRPVLVDAAAQSDLDPRLFMIGMAAPVAEKPLAKPPAFWRQASYLDWLTAPQDDDRDVAVDAIGIPGPVAESRVHVRIDPATGTADEGFLFQTSGLEFERRPPVKPDWRLDGTTPLGLLVITAAEIDAGAGCLGGERRTVFWQRAASDLLPDCPPTLRAAIAAARACRLILTTPGIFADGLLPQLDWLAIPGLEVTVKGAAASRYDVISGWDYAAGMAKATRRLAPAGAVYYLSLAGSSDAAIDQFVARVWFHPVSDDAQDRRDGFGVAALGAWDGKQVQMEVKPCHKNQ